MITENLSTLRIHKLTQEQYERELANNALDENALYLTPEEEIDLTPYATIERLDESLNEAKEYTNTKTANLASTATVDTKISTHNVSDVAHNDIRLLIADLTAQLNTLANSSDETLAQMNELVGYIESNQDLIESITTGKVNVSDIVNNLTTNVTDKPLGADQGVALKELIDSLRGDMDDSFSAMSDDLYNKADKTHTHDDRYYTESEIDTRFGAMSDDVNANIEAAVADKADSDHTHAISDVINLQTTLDNKANSSHTHTEYMSTDNPVGSGSFSMGRKYGTVIGTQSHTEGSQGTASGGCSHAEGLGTTASGECAHAEGYITIASGNYSHAEGSSFIDNEDGALIAQTEASGDYSHAEGAGTTASGMASHAEGIWTTASGEGAHAEGYVTIASGNFSHAEGYRTTALACQHVQGHFNNTTTATAGTWTGTEGTAFAIGNGTGYSNSNAFRVGYSGEVYATSSSINTGADYAEFFEWQDANPNVEDRRGYFVTLDGEQIRIAQPNDYILGIVSGQPAVIGNGDEDWRGRYILDEFGAFIIEEFQYEEKVFDKETGKTNTVIKTGTKYKENPEYNPSLPYVQRKDRPEWDAVGMVGVLSVRDDGTCKVNGYCTVAEGGIATASENGYRVIKRVSDNIIKVIFK